MLFKPMSRFLTCLLSQKDDFPGYGFPGATVLDGDASLRGTATEVHFDQAIEPTAFLPIGGGVRGAGMALAAGSAAIALNGLRIIKTMITSVFDRARCSAAGT